MYGVFARIERIDGQIVHPSTLQAANMAMFFGAVIEPHLRPAQLHFLDLPGGRQDLQIAIDGAQADAGQFSANPIINLIGGEMMKRFSDRLENNITMF
jgi:hypothetical protein